MPQQIYETEKEKEHYYYAYGTRKIWAGGISTYAAYYAFQMMEYLLKNGMISVDEAQRILDTFDFKFPSMGYRAKVIDAWSHGIVIPYGRGIERIMKEIPQSIAIVGDVKSGKTVTSWTLLWKLWNDLGQAGEVHVYGDIDNITGGLLKLQEKGGANYELGKFVNSLVIHDDYKTPGIPENGVPQLILYNELAEQLLSKKATSTENIEINLQAFRRRHTKRWIFYNVVREASLEAVLRETSQIKIFRPMFGELLDKLLKNAPKSWYPVLKEVPSLSNREGLCIYPIMGEGGGEVMEIYETEAPSWYWKAKDLAELNKRIAYGDESVPVSIIKEAINLYKSEEMSFREVSKYIREKYGYDKNHQWWGKTIKEMDPEYIPHKGGKKKPAQDPQITGEDGKENNER
ncbi:MAG: hypothetical protein QXU98_07705 [Candidatus Parvarchaeota archaeon]